MPTAHRPQVIIAVTGEDDQYGAVRSRATALAQGGEGTVILYDIDAGGLFASPVPTEWSGDGDQELTAEEAAPGDRLGPDDLETVGRGPGQAALEKADVFASLTEMVKYTTITEAVLDLKAGGIDAIVADEIFARYAVSKEVNAFKVPDDVFGSENYGIGFRLKDVTLRDKIDEIIDEMAEDGTALEISLKWFGEDLLLR